MRQYFEAILLVFKAKAKGVYINDRALSEEKSLSVQKTTQH